MDKLKNAVTAADDDYLTGLSNKGILKRAYKDLESSEISAAYMDGSAYITIGKEKCVISVPIAESQCTCPSRTVCRHIITSVLWLKQNLKADENNEENKEETTEKTNPKNNEETKTQKSLDEILSSVSLKTIQKSMKKRYYNSFIEKAKLGFFPRLEEMSVVTAEFPEDGTIVKLLSPLEYSACTCHSKDFCRHKAAAVLAWQIKHKIIDISELKTESETTSKIDVEDIHDTAKYTLRFLYDLLSDGLVRASENIAEQAESTAVLCHNSRLADSERTMREIGSRLSAYIDHSPEFNADMLFSLIIENISRLKKIINENDSQNLEMMIGEFKSKYSVSDTIEILPIAQRYFSSASGYEGNIYYFLNKSENTENRFLSYSNIRPTFYEARRGYNPNQALWGLYGGISEISKSELRLTLPKLSGGKISSSSETKAEIICPADINQDAVKNLIYTDYSKLVSETFSHQSKTENDTLVFLGVKKYVSGFSDEITQTHTITVEDIFGHHLSVKMRYKAENKTFFELFVKTGEYMKKHFLKDYVIFGNAYIEEGKCCIYPIAVFDKIEKVFKNSEKSKEPFCKAQEENGYSYFSEYFRQVKKMLCDIIQCGINSFDLYQQVFDFSQEGERMGLLSISDKLNILGEKLKAKNHSSRNDNSEIISIIADIYNYISLGITKTETHLAIKNLC